jgi:hypothetical protein
MERAILTIVALSVFAGLGLSGCVGPGYGPTYGYPAYGYAPYSYGFPVYASGYQPDFVVHHPWEDHHAYGHPAPQKRATRAAASPGIPAEEASAVAVTVANARLRSPRSFQNTNSFQEMPADPHDPGGIRVRSRLLR